jgi:ornithine lipid hydroxylase
MTDAASVRAAAAWFTFPVMMGGFVAVAVLGLERGIDPGRLTVELAVLNFFVILGLEQVLPRNPAINAFRDRQSLNDLGHGLLLSFARPFSTAVGIALVAWLAEWRLGSGLATVWPASWPFAAQFTVAFALLTFLDYWVHRSFHTFDWLWWFHAIHHDTPQMHILKSGRIHAGEELLNALLKPLPLLLLGAPPDVMVLLGMWRVFDGNLVHSNIAQRFPSWAHYFVPTVQLHNLHHAQDRRQQDTNYSGSTAFWDWLFGTFSHPERCPLGPLGIAGSTVPKGFLAQLAYPFRHHGLPAAEDAVREPPPQTPSHRIT